MKRKITEIMEDMDQLEKVEISGELVDTLKDYFREEIETENINKKSHDEKVAKGAVDNLAGSNRGNAEHGQSDRI